MTAYLDRAADDGVRHAEIFFDPQSHTGRGVGFEVFMRGFRDAISDGRRRRGISADLIMCFLRHLSGEEAVSTIEEAEPFLDGVIGVGIDSSERDRPPQLFEKAYARARQLGLRPSPTPARKARQSTSELPSTSSERSGSITVCAASRTRTWWRG